VSSYDAVYSRPEFYWGREPNGLCRQVIDLFAPGEIPGKRLVDLGCGEGRDLIAFARAGFTAVGVDTSRPGLDKAQRWAAAEGLPVETQQASLLDLQLEAPCDVVYSSGTMTFLPPALRPDYFAQLRRLTPAGGIHAMNVFVEKPFLATPPDWDPAESFYRSGELLGYYWDWEILSFREFIFDCNSSGVPHRHAMDVLVARRVTPAA